MIYLATPYWHPYARVRACRATAASYVAANLIQRRQKPVFCPIVYGHFQLRFQLPENFDWIAFDKKILAVCDEFIIGKLPGWSLSKGIAEETAFAHDNAIPIVYWDPQPIIPENIWEGCNA